MNNSRAVSPSPAFNRVAFPETATLTHSGGTAPVLHRTSLLCPYWAPEVYKYARTKRRIASMVGGSESGPDGPIQRSVSTQSFGITESHGHSPTGRLMVAGECPIVGLGSFCRCAFLGPKRVRWMDRPFQSFGGCRLANYH
jgi:hypothetical protein